MLRKEDVFPELAPPPHGLTSMRAKLDELDARSKKRERFWWALSMPAAAAVAIAGVVVFTNPEAEAPHTLLQHDSNPALLRMRLEPHVQAAAVVRGEARATTALLPVSESGDVAFYWLAGR